MSLKAISFIGVGKYHPINYIWEEGEKEKSFETHLFPLAVYKFFKPKKLYIFCTERTKTAKREGAKKTYVEEIEEYFKNFAEKGENFSYQFVDIPEGKNVEELWEIFDRLSSVIEEEDELVIDVTHAFRSIPMFSLAVATYLKYTKRVSIKHIVYGAFEASYEKEGKKFAPIFDLGLFLEILKWLSASEKFLEFSYGITLGSILKETHTGLWKEKKSRAEELPRKLKRVGGALEGFSYAVWLAQPVEIMKRANNLVKLLKEALSEFEAWAKPFKVILERVLQRIERISYPEPEVLSEENLKVQKRICRFLLEQNLYMQAIAVAREWLISWIILKSGNEEWIKNWRDNRKVRNFIEKDLGRINAYYSKGNEKTLKEMQNKYIFKMTEEFDLKGMLTLLFDTRNEIAHCGMKKEAKPPEALLENIKKVIEKIEKL